MDIFSGAIRWLSGWHTSKFAVFTKHVTKTSVLVKTLRSTKKQSDHVMFSSKHVFQFNIILMEKTNLLCFCPQENR